MEQHQALARTVVNNMIIMCSDKDTIKKLEAMGYKSFNKNSDIVQFMVPESIDKMSFDNEISSKILFTNKMKF